MRLNSKDKKYKNKKADENKEITSNKPKEIYLIEEFFTKHKFKKTLDAFLKEWPTVFTTGSLVYDLISAFEEGNYETFFPNWEKLKKGFLVKHPERDIKELEFNLHVYFAIYNILAPGGKSAAMSKPAINLFKHFLEEKGADYSSQREFIPLFALPYINDISENSVFSHLIQPEWTSNLTGGLKEIIKKAYNPSSSLEACVYRDIFKENDIVGKDIETLNKFIEIGQILIGILSKYQLSYPDRETALKCARQLHEAKGQSKEEAEIPQQDFPHSMSTIYLDFPKLKAALKESKEPTFLSAVLQAIRRKVVNATCALKRREFIIQMSSSDFIDYELFSFLLEKKHKALSQNIIALVNALASDYVGRSYLIENQSLLKHLIYILKAEPRETFMRKNVLGILQKLSLRRKSQEILVNNDIIKWAVGVISSEKMTLTEYSLEYTCALLLNLSLRTIGKEKFEEIKYSVLTLFGELIYHENQDIKSFVNGTLYSLFTKPTIKKLAIEMGYEKKIRELLSRSAEELQARYRYILDQLLNDSLENNLSQMNEDENDFDLLEEEEILFEDVNEIPDDISYQLADDDLLAPFYLIGEEAEKRLQIVSAILEETVNQSKFEMTKPPSIFSGNMVEIVCRPHLRSKLN